MIIIFRSLVFKFFKIPTLKLIKSIVIKVKKKSIETKIKVKKIQLLKISFTFFIFFY